MGLVETTGLLIMVWAYCIQKIRNSKLGYISQEQLTTSNVMSKWALGAIRLVIGGYVLGIWIHRAIRGSVSQFCMDYEPKACVPYGGIWTITTFTIWCWVGQGVYFVITGLITVTKVKAPNWLLFILWVAFQVQLCAALMVTLVVWLVLAPTLSSKIKNFPAGGDPKTLEILKTRSKVMNSDFAVLVHSANLLFMIIEFAYNRLPFNRAHFPFAVMYGLLYALFAWVFYWYTGVWYYFFLDYNKPTAFVGYSGLLIALYLFFQLAITLSNAKQSFFSSQRTRAPTRTTSSLLTPKATERQGRSARKGASGGRKKSAGSTPGTKLRRVSKSPKRR